MRARGEGRAPQTPSPSSRRRRSPPLEPTGPSSPSGNCEYHFLDLRFCEVFRLFQIDMREVGHFIGRDDAVDNGRPFDPERLVDGLAQLAGFSALKPAAPQARASAT